jgi:transcription antitermination factor NusG
MTSMVTGISENRNVDICDVGSPAVTSRVSSQDCITRQWFALYTCANHEARVAENLGFRLVEYFLPLFRSTRRWKDRRVHLELPLFPGYVFVRIAVRNRIQVLQVPGVVRLVGFDGVPAVLPDEQINALKRALEAGLIAEPHPYLTVGRQVRIKGGPLQGQEGIVIRKKGAMRVVVSLAQISCSMIADVEATDIEPIPSIQRVKSKLKGVD